MGNPLQSFTVSATTTNVNTSFTGKISSVLLRTPSSNTDDVFVVLGNSPATSGSTLRLPAGTTISVDIELQLLLRGIKGLDLRQDDFLNSFSASSGSGTQTLYVDALQWR